MKTKSKLIIALMMIFMLSINSLALADNIFLQPQERLSINKALAYLHSVQNPDGGFPAQKGSSSNSAVSSWVLMALASAGEDAGSKAWAPHGKTVIDYLNNCGQKPVSSCDYARTLLAWNAGKQGGKYQNQDLLKKITSFQQNSGQYAQLSLGEKGFINSHLWSVLAIYSSSGQIKNKEKVKDWLVKRQNADGGFSWCEGVSSDADDSAVALQVLTLLGEDPAKSKVIGKTLAYLKSCQKGDGGFSSGQLAGNKSNASTDAWVIQGLLACGQNPADKNWSVNGKNAVSHLLSLQSGSGSFNWMPGVASSPVNCTACAIIALSRTPFPVNIYKNRKI